MIAAKSPDSSGCSIGTAPFSTWPLPPSMVMMSPLLQRRAHRHQRAGRGSRRAASRRPRRRACPCRAPPPPHGWSCRRAWSGCPSAACMPWMSSGLVSMRTRITLRPAPSCSSASSRGEDDLAGRGTRRGRQADADHVARAPWDRWSGAAAGRARPDRCAATASSCVISPSPAMSTAIFSAAFAVRLPERVCSIQSLPRSMVNSRSCMSR